MSGDEIHSDSWILIEWTVTKRMRTFIPAQGLAEYVADAELTTRGDPDYRALLNKIGTEDTPARRTLLGEVAEDWRYTERREITSVWDVEIKPTGRRGG